MVVQIEIRKLWQLLRIHLLLHCVPKLATSLASYTHQWRKVH